MNLTIEYFAREVYGKTFYYIKSPEIARHVKSLTDANTLQPRHVEALKALGCAFKLVLDPQAKTL